MDTQNTIPLSITLVEKYKVKSITGCTFKIDNGVIAKSGYKSSYEAFDTNGHRIQSLEYNPEGKVIREVIFDPDGKVIKEISYVDPNGIVYEYRFIYDDKGKLKEKSMYIDGSFWNKLVAERDQDGFIIKDYAYDSTNKNTRIDYYSYDETHHLIQKNMGHLGVWYYQYDDNHNLIKLSGDIASGSEAGEVYEFYYDDKGLLLKKIHMYDSVTTYEYLFYENK